MSHFVMQFEMIRKNLQQFLKSTSEDLFDQMPKGFRNTIRWNVGHILTVADAIFGLNKLPADYKGLFWKGTKPADWTGEVPSPETLASQLQEQTTQIKETFGNRLEEKLAKPIHLNGYQIETIGSVFCFNNMHESVHIGYMNALKRAVEGQSARYQSSM